MADTWIQGSFAFRCTAPEAALLAQAVDASHDLMAGFDPDPPGAELLAAFPPCDAADPWSGFRDAFDDPEFPAVGADFEGRTCPDHAALCVVSFASMSDFCPSAIAMLIQRCCPETLKIAPIGFEWAVTCSKPRLDEFGGGWCAVFADHIDIESTCTALSHALAGGIL